VHAAVELGSLTPDDVEVQVAFGRVDESDQIRHPSVVSLKAREQVGTGWRYEGSVPLERTGPFGYTVRVLPQHPLLASSAELGLIVEPVESTEYTGVPPR
jgi:starch phosphorylase